MDEAHPRSAPRRWTPGGVARALALVAAGRCGPPLTELCFAPPPSQTPDSDALRRQAVRSLVARAGAAYNPTSLEDTPTPVPEQEKKLSLLFPPARLDIHWIYVASTLLGCPEGCEPFQDVQRKSKESCTAGPADLGCCDRNSAGSGQYRHACSPVSLGSGSSMPCLAWWRTQNGAPGTPPFPIARMAVPAGCLQRPGSASDRCGGSHRSRLGGDGLTGSLARWPRDASSPKRRLPWKSPQTSGL